MRISHIYDQGTAPFREDGLVVTKSLFGVFDGVSAPYAPNHPHKLFGKLSGGEMISRLCENTCRLHDRLFDSQKTKLLALIKVLNKLVKEKQQQAGISHEDAGELAGATFAIIRIVKEQIVIVQAGDCMAVIEFDSGEIIITPNQVRLHDIEMTAEIEKLQREIAQERFGFALEEMSVGSRNMVRQEMWNRFYKTLREARRLDVNNRHSQRGYGLLNGQPAVLDMLWLRIFDRADVSSILLFSDGMIPWNIMKSSSDEEIGRTAFDHFEKQGLAGLLLSARRIEGENEEENAAASYVSQAEATAIALDFNDEK